MLEVFREGVKLTQTEMSRRRLKETGTYDVDAKGWSFGASGYEDLPNSEYVCIFKEYLLETLRQNCPSIEIISGDNTYLKLAANAKKGW